MNFVFAWKESNDRFIEIKYLCENVTLINYSEIKNGKRMSSAFREVRSELNKKFIVYFRDTRSVSRLVCFTFGLPHKTEVGAGKSEPNTDKNKTSGHLHLRILLTSHYSYILRNCIYYDRLPSRIGVITSERK